MFEIGSSLLLTLHLLMVNVATGAPFFCIWLEWRESARADATAGELRRYFAWRSLDLLLGGTLAGLVLLGWLWWRDESPYLTALGTIPARRWWFLGIELVFSPACMGIYLATLRRPRRWYRLLPLLAGTNLAYHFPTLFTIVAVVSQRSALWHEPVSFVSMLADREVLTRVCHFLLASLAVSAVLCLVRLVRGQSSESAQRLVGRGAWLALGCTALQLPVGLAVLLTLPEQARADLTGHDPLATGVFALGIMLSLLLMHQLAGVALGEREPAAVLRAALVLGCVVLLMVAARQRMRNNLYERHAATTAARPTMERPASPRSLRSIGECAMEVLSRFQQPLAQLNVTARKYTP